MLEIMEPVIVWVLFEEANIQPLSFTWRGRKIKIDKVNLVHTSKEGTSVFYHFSISSGSNFYRLRLEDKTLKWTLEMVEED